MLHRDHAAGQALAAAHARAMAIGEHVFLGERDTMLDRPASREVLFHELGHVQQHRLGQLHASAGGPLSGPEEPLEQGANLRDVGPILRQERSPNRGGGALLSESARVMRWTGPDGRPHEKDDMDAVEESLEYLGVTRIGDLSPIQSWSDPDIEKTFDTLAKIKAGGGLFGSRDRIINSWNRAADDLGDYENILVYVKMLDDWSRETLHDDYVPAMNALKHKKVFLAGIEVAVHPRAVYFVAAGQVNMDSEVGMAVGEGHFAPRGGFQYMLKSVIKELGIIAGGRKEVKTVEVQKGKRTKKERQTTFVPWGGGLAAYRAILADLIHMRDVMRAQQLDESVPGHRPWEHREPLLVEYFAGKSDALDDARADANTVKSDEEAKSAASALLVTLGELPTRTDVNHMYGAIDPHGTDHAMGLAIDIHKGLSSGAMTNSGFKDQLVLYHMLIQYWGHETADYGDGFEPLDPSMRPKYTTSMTPGQLASLNRLAREHAGDLQKKMTENENLQTPDSLKGTDDRTIAVALSNARKAYVSLRKTATLAFRTRAGIYAKIVGDGRNFDRLGEGLFSATRAVSEQLDGSRKAAETSIAPGALEDLLVAGSGAIIDLIDEARERQPISDAEVTDTHARRAQTLADERGTIEQKKAEAQLDYDNKPTKTARAAIKAADTALAGIETKTKKNVKKEDRERGKRSKLFMAFESGAPDAGRAQLQFPVILDAVAHQGERARWAAAHDALAEFREAKSVKKWVSVMSDPDAGFFDQSAVMMRALDDVQGHSLPPGCKEGEACDDRHVQSGHHWEVAALGTEHTRSRTNIMRNADYQKMLEQDMTYRKNQGGDRLFRILMVMAESEVGREVLTSDNIFEKALSNVMKDRAVSMCDQALETVRGTSVIESNDLRHSLRHRGRYL